MRVWEWDGEEPGRCRNVGILGVAWLLLLIFLVPVRGGSAEGGSAPGAGVPAAGCREVALTGEVESGREWSAAIGEGWVFRLVPIAPSGKGYTGWDLSVDRPGSGDGGYPDALLLGTPPYGSLSEREIGTTYGLRAQDAIAWSPRRFRFLGSVADLRRARELYGTLMAGSGNGRSQAQTELLAMMGRSESVGTGRFTVLDARLRAGVGDPPVFASAWTGHLAAVPHTLEQTGGETGGRAGGAASQRGELRWIRFEAVLRLPRGWQTSRGLGFKAASCSE